MTYLTKKKKSSLAEEDLEEDIERHMEILSDATFKGQIIAENYINSKRGLYIGNSSITEFISDDGMSFITFGGTNDGLIGNANSGRNICFYIGGVNSNGSACLGSPSIVASRKMETCYATIGCLFLGSSYVSIDGSGYINLTHMSNEISNFSSTYLSKTDASSTYLTKTAATSTYLSKNDASSTYLSKANAKSTYLSRTDAESTYVQQSSATKIKQIKIDFDVPASCTKFTVPTGLSGPFDIGSMAMFRCVDTSDLGYKHPNDQLFKQVSVDLYQIGCSHTILVEKSSSFSIGASDGYRLRLTYGDLDGQNINGGMN